MLGRTVHRFVRGVKVSLCLTAVVRWPLQILLRLGVLCDYYVAVLLKRRYLGVERVVRRLGRPLPT